MKERNELAERLKTKAIRGAIHFVDVNATYNKKLAFKIPTQISTRFDYLSNLARINIEIITSRNSRDSYIICTKPEFQTLKTYYDSHYQDIPLSCTYFGLDELPSDLRKQIGSLSR